MANTIEIADGTCYILEKIRIKHNIEDCITVRENFDGMLIFERFTSKDRGQWKRLKTEHMISVEAASKLSALLKEGWFD